MLGNLDLDYISISSSYGEMEPPIVKSSCKNAESNSQEFLEGPQLPIYWDIACNINNTLKLSWFDIYFVFCKRCISYDQEDFKIYINIKRSSHHKVAMHLLIFLCVETFDSALQNTDTTRWVIRNHIGEAFASISSAIFLPIIGYQRMSRPLVLIGCQNSWWKLKMS